MISIRLGAEDRDALGAPEVMTVEPTKLRLSEVRALRKGTGMGVEDLAAGLNGQNLEAIAALVWIALYRAGVQVSFDDLDFAFGDLQLEVDDEGNPPAPDGA